MKMTKRSRRTARKLVLPLLAIGVMTTMMYIGRPSAPAPSIPSAAPAAARMPHNQQR